MCPGQLVIMTVNDYCHPYFGPKPDCHDDHRAPVPMSADDIGIVIATVPWKTINQVYENGGCEVLVVWCDRDASMGWVAKSSLKMLWGSHA